ncbi:hypothetical protein FB45DRAFT_1060557 [Roridomyces roridus]|uniref:Uncharacterized protein n=1 Tax=Roridomyces roridus TaxID=1738132 RepID=A0AAD7FLN3_9AGAR|nr:hypothetical protein FB45DRAFT_1060557 [Roridomyces roridus]
MTTIHPALLPRNISKLPFSLQRVVRIAMSQGSWIGSGASGTAIQQLGAMSPEQTLGLLPAIYVLLDPSSIPSLDTPAKVLCGLSSAMMTWSFLETSLRAPTFPRAASAELWPRLWAWMEFFSLYSEDVIDASQAALFFRSVLQVVINPVSTRLLD